MNECCYTLSVRQIRCQNGVRRQIDNVYTNVVRNSIIPLSFGYLLTFISANQNNVTIQLSNPGIIPNLLFNIPCGGFKTFDLPTESGTLRVLIGATSIDCSNTVICCSI